MRGNPVTSGKSFMISGTISFFTGDSLRVGN